MDPVGEFIKNKYDSTALAYAAREKSVYQFSNHSRLPRDYLRRHPVDLVLDIGCGSGAVIRRLAPEYPQTQFVGVDFSAELIRLGRGHGPASNVQFCQADVTEWIETAIRDWLTEKRRVLLLVLGPMEYYGPSDGFALAVRRLWQAIHAGAMVSLFLNRRHLSRVFYQGKNKKYWREEESREFFGLTRKNARCRYYSCIFYDAWVTRSPAWDRIFLMGDRILGDLPVPIASRFAATFSLFAEK